MCGLSCRFAINDENQTSTTSVVEELITLDLTVGIDLDASRLGFLVQDVGAHQAVRWPNSSNVFPASTGHSREIGYAIQRADPGEYYHWHIDGGSHEFADRQLVAIWYLNDPQGTGGETEFEYQDLSVTPEAGKLPLFPPFWTHRHRGATLKQGRKYIATTWVLFA